jgi:hypothetical protein
MQKINKPLSLNQKKTSNQIERFLLWVEDRTRTGDPRYHKPML